VLVLSVTACGHDDFESEPRVFPVVSGKKIVGTAFVFKVSDSKSCVISWSACKQATCKMFVKGNGNKTTGTVHSILLKRVRDDMDNDTGLLHATLPEECDSVPNFEAAEAPRNTKTGSLLFMAARRGRCECSLCLGLIGKRMSKTCDVKSKNVGYVRKSGGSFRSHPLGAPLVNGEGKLVAVVTEFEGKKLKTCSIGDVLEKLD
jgi:hypothetical protein